MTITKENFFDEWKKIDGKYRYSKKCKLIGTLTTSIGELLLALGIIVTICYASIKKVTELEILLNYVGVYVGLVIALCLCFAILVHIFYHPFKAKHKEDAWVENAKTMAEMAVTTRVNIKGIKKEISNAAWLIYILATMVDITATSIGTWESPILNFLPPNYINMDEGGMILMGMIEIVSLYLIHKIFKLITRWFYFCPVSYKEVLRAEEFRVEMEEETSEKSERERLILSDVLLENGVLALSKKEFKEAKDYFLKSAILGNVVGMDRLALFHGSIERDKEISVYWYKKCIDSGVATKDTKKHLRMVKNSIKLDNYY